MTKIISCVLSALIVNPAWAVDAAAPVQTQAEGV